jgi:hypothetical protein
MAKAHPKREQAKKLFVEHGMSAKDVSELIGVSEQSVGKWRNQDSWDEDRSFYDTTPEALIKYIYAQINMIKDSAIEEGTDKPRLLTPTEVNSITTLASSIQKLRGEINPQTVMKILNDFVVYLQIEDLDLAKSIADKVAEYYTNYKNKKS